MLAERGDLDEAEQILRPYADAGDTNAAGELTELLGRHRDLDELRARADAGQWYAAGMVAQRLADRGDLDELRARANADDYGAAGQLTHLLADQLIKQGRGEEAERLRRFGLNPDGSIASA
jgi:hypothetical protein